MEKESKKTEVYKAIPKEKVVFASFVCEHTFYEDKFSSNVDFLGISDAKKEEKICDECIMKWRPITVIEPEPDNKILYKVKGEYFFDNELMRLTIRDKIVFMVELDKFNIDKTLTYCNTIDQKMYEKIAELFKIYRHEHDKLSNTRNDINKLFEE